MWNDLYIFVLHYPPHNTSNMKRSVPDLCLPIKRKERKRNEESGHRFLIQKMAAVICQNLHACDVMFSVGAVIGVYIYTRILII